MEWVRIDNFASENEDIQKSQASFMCTQIQTHLEARRGSESSGVRVTGDCEFPGVDAVTVFGSSVGAL